MGADVAFRQRAAEAHYLRQQCLHAEDVLRRALKGEEHLFYRHAVREKMHRSPHCPCGSCRHFDGWDIERPSCTHFPDGVSPADVYFDGAPCPAFAKC